MAADDFARALVAFQLPERFEVLLGEPDRVPRSALVEGPHDAPRCRQLQEFPQCRRLCERHVGESDEDEGMVGGCSDAGGETASHALRGVVGDDDGRVQRFDQPGDGLVVFLQDDKQLAERLCVAFRGTKHHGRTIEAMEAFVRAEAARFAGRQQNGRRAGWYIRDQAARVTA